MIYLNLYNGIKMPIVGYGTYKITDKIDARQCVIDALETGYRRIDTATLYRNEKEIGLAVKESGIPRQELFIATKLWTDVLSYDQTLQTFEIMCENLQSSYIDLLMIHWPTKANIEVWSAMEKLYSDGFVKAIGVSNFKEHHIEEIMANGHIKPMIDQIEFHPIFQQRDLCDYCQKNNILIEAWSPLMRGKALDLQQLVSIGMKHNKSASQVIIRYDIQSGLAVIPKTTNKERMRENIDVFDFELSNEEMLSIKALDRNERQYRDPDNHGY